MQFLIFHLGKDRYGVPLRDVRRVLPLMELKRLPHAPDFVAGIMNLHGAPVPVIDLCRLACGKDCEARFDTRILLVDFPSADAVLPLGLVAEGVSGVQDIDPGAFAAPGIRSPDAPWLGKVSTGQENMVQLIAPALLLTEPVRAMLYPRGEASR
ncbi:MAG TPA: chemotaxis protein CheW [Noviherbaspirillum sp.]|jgi:chemotaxis-related protein WspB|uniref:chemotaxis protein CheW n=1 Tax=Noviherbaspirillum sp. TaxID=1926288 RepID=UPI002F94D7C6